MSKVARAIKYVNGLGKEKWVAAYVSYYKDDSPSEVLRVQARVLGYASYYDDFVLYPTDNDVVLYASEAEALGVAQQQVLKLLSNDWRPA